LVYLTIWAPESDDHSESHCAARPTAARYRLSRYNALWKRYKKCPFLLANLTNLKYRLLMALRSEDLPSDPARLIEMVLSLDAENDRLRAVIGTFKDMVCGSRSEKLAAVVADQLALDLADLATDVTLPSAANDDRVPSTPAGATGGYRKKAQRNIGALPKHLPRCEQVIEPETTACPCCQSRLHKIGQDVTEVLDVFRRSCGCCA
jgi:hypothetical protein